MCYVQLATVTGTTISSSARTALAVAAAVPAELSSSPPLGSDGRALPEDEFVPSVEAAEDDEEDRSASPSAPVEEEEKLLLPLPPSKAQSTLAFTPGPTEMQPLASGNSTSRAPLWLRAAHALASL